jgi:hypothetical protein
VRAEDEESPEFPPVFTRNRRGNDITCNSALASAKIVDVGGKLQVAASQSKISMRNLLDREHKMEVGKSPQE